MQPVFTVKQSQEFDRYLIEKLGIPSSELMENAATGCITAIKDWLRDGTSFRVLVLCGSGNNGGDGFAITRLLRARSIDACAIRVGTGKLSIEAGKQFEALSAVAEIETFRDESQLQSANVLIDAILGTGSSGELRGEQRTAVEAINRWRRGDGERRVLAVDIPTGLDADRGSSNDAIVIRADRTATMAAPKLGFYQRESKAFTGDVVTVDIGGDVAAFRAEGEHAQLVTPDDIRSRLPHHGNTASKFSRGRVLAVCGSRGMTGAAIMAAGAALRSGCGLVNVAVPKSERSLVAQAMPELLTVGCNEQQDGGPDISAWDELQEHLDRSDVVLVGSGLRPWKGTAELLRKIIKEVDKPMVIDAGALGALAGHLDLLKNRKAPTILTPHSGELSRMLEISWEEVEENRLQLAREFAKRHRVIVAMKGAPTYTIDRDGTTYINSTGNMGLATAGSGDVLAGIMASMLVQMREDPIGACMTAVYLHGLAGDFARDAKTSMSMTATDVTEYLPDAFKELGVR